MSPKEIKALVKTLRSLGVSHYKTADLELTLEPLPQELRQPKENRDSIATTELSPEEDQKIRNKIEELKSVVLGTDEELLNRLFPTFTELKEMQ